MVEVTVTGVILAAHIGLGTAALILGPVAMFARKLPGVHTRAGEAYHWVILGVCVTAALLAALAWAQLWWFLPIAAGSYAFAFVGYIAAKRRWRGWLRTHLAGQGGSYIAMTTALLVVNWQTFTGTRGVESVWAWAIPTLVGTPLLIWLRREVVRGRRPRLGRASPDRRAGRGAA